MEQSKKIKPWWTGDNGKTCITIRYGVKPLELQVGLNAVETSGIEEVITTLQVIKTALEAGGLDAQIEALTSKSSKVAEVVQTKRPILGLKK